MPSFRRVLLSPERLPEELKRVQEGVLVRLPLSEFDALVEGAARATKRRISPQLLEAHYHATLQEESLIGEGQWKLVHAGPGPGLLNLQPFNLALRQARFENGDAIIAAFDGKTPALLVESPGERTVSLDWSARAESNPEGLQFHLEMPPCPVALLELDVPDGRGVTVLNDSALLSGPHEADKNHLRRWRIVCGGRQRVDRQRVDLRIYPAERTAAGAQAQAVPFVHKKTTQKLHPEGLDATFELTLNGLTRGIRELVCECDPVLRLRDVVGPGIEDYSFQAGEGNKLSRLTVRLREPVRAGTWKILCLAPLNGQASAIARDAPSPTNPQSITWRSPGLHLLNSVPRGETLTLWLHPDLRVESWDCGSYRLTSSDLDRASGYQVLTLLGGGLGPLRRPATRLQAYSVEFSTQQLTWWRCNAGGMGLTVQIGWDVSQGQLFQLPVLLPAGWEVEKVEMASASLRDWHVRKVAGEATLLVDLESPLGPRPLGDPERTTDTTSRPSLLSPGRAGGPRLSALTVQLRPSVATQMTEQRLRFPDVVPLGARFREGALALDCDEQLFNLQVQTSAERAEPEPDGPWGQQVPDYYYRYRGQPVTGEILVRARPPRLRSKCQTEVVVAGGEAVVESRLLLEAEAGSPNTIDLLLSSGDGGGWQWRTDAPRSEEATSNRVRRAERDYKGETSSTLHLLATPNPLQAAVVVAARPTSEHWRLTLARPLRLREPLRLRARRRLVSHDNRWEVPLPVVLGTQRMEGEVVLHLEDAGLAVVHSDGLHESSSSTEKGATPWRSFHYGPGAVRLTLSGEARASDRFSVAAIENARLITYDGQDGMLRRHFSFQVTNWGERTLPLRLPAGSRPLAVQVDGCWLPRLIPGGEASANQEESVPVELALPVPHAEYPSARNKVRFFEVVYTNRLSATYFWHSLDAPAPQLPIAPVALRRIWRLSPKLTPLHQERYQSLPATARESEPALPRHVPDLFHLPGHLNRFDPLLEDHQAGAEEALRQAVQRLYDRHADQAMSLREIVNETALETSRDHYPFVIDELALREAGVEAGTRLSIKRLPSLGETHTPPTSPWAECGLIAVPAHSAILLTTSSGHGAVLREPISAEIKNALSEAVQYGQDATGRFHSALSWLYPEDLAPSTNLGSRRLDFTFEGGNWNEWEPIVGSNDEQLLVVRRDEVSFVGLALGLLIALSFGLIRPRSVHRRLKFLLMALAVSGLGVLWLPASVRDLAWWPLLACGAVAAWVYLIAIIRRPVRSQSTPHQSQNAAPIAVVTGLLMLGVFGWNGRAAAPAPATVYLVPASADAPEKQTALVPADLLDRLKTLARPVPLTPEGEHTVLLDASYEGTLVEEGKQAEFLAVFSAYSLSDESSTLVVPLAGVQLVGEVLLDGARVSPLAAPQAGYSLPVRGRGRHKIELRFRVPVIGTIEDRNVLFTAPPLLRSRLSWHVPSGAVEPHVVVKNGAQWTKHDGAERLEADLGALPLPVHLHWYQPSRPTQVSYQAAYVWNLGVEVSHLTAYLRYRVEQGAIKTLDVDLPAELEISTANAQRTPTLFRPSWRSRFQLHDWYVTHSGNKRVLHLELPYPISGDFQVTLELLPRAPLISPAVLPLPSPLGIDADGPHYLAYRTQPGLSAQRETSQYLTRIDNKEFAPDWVGGPTLDTTLQGIAYRIPADRTPQLILRLESMPPLVQGEVDLMVRVDSQRAEFEAIADITAPNKDLAALDWELPPNCILTAATGDDVRTWKQSGPRLLVWLNRTTAKTRVHLSGWLPLSRREGYSHLELTGPCLLHADKLLTRLHLTPSGDLDLTAIRTENLQPGQSNMRSRDRTSDFETWSLTYHLDCQVQATANAVAQVLTVAEVADRELRFTSTIDYSVTHGELRQVRLRLRNWDEEKVEVRAEQVALWEGPRRLVGERSWHLPLQSGVRGHYQVTLRGSMPLEKAAGGVPMPEVLVQGVEHADYFVAAGGIELTAQPTGSLQPLKPENRDPKADPAISDLLNKGKPVWRISGAEWQVTLRPQARELLPTPVQVYLLEQGVAAADGRRWLHETCCWLRHEPHANFILDFAAPVRVLAASIDGVEATLRSELRDPKAESQPGPSDFGFRISDFNKRVWLHLPSQTGVRCVRLRWMYDPAEPLENPNLTSPQLTGVMKGPTLWTILVPPGWQASLAGASSWLGAAREAQLALGRADAQLRISQDLARERRDASGTVALAAAQQRFDLYCRHARRAFEMDSDAGDTANTRREQLAIWLKELQDKNRTLRNEIPILQSEILLAVSNSGLKSSTLDGMGGIPLSWQVAPEAEPFNLQLTSNERQQTRHALLASGQWLGVLAAVWLLSTLPFVKTLLRLLWPEQIALLALLGLHLAGLTTIVLALLILAISGRIFLVIRGLRALLQKHGKQPSTMTADPGALS